ncbi:MAG: pantetheine-phosphate adenylyltransferase [Clostridia bacterium]|nr:pantetheine-phosphate adenylyltransferase [Clostridia bacterium]
MRVALYPGSFDPVTNGHLDIIARAAGLFDRVIVSVSQNVNKRPLFSVTERKAMLQEVLQAYPNVEIVDFMGLTVNFARKVQAQAIIRGLRAISDFENEFMMALTNKKLAPEIETVFLMAKAEYSFISSSGVKELARFSASIEGLVPKIIEDKLIEKFKDF